MKYFTKYRTFLTLFFILSVLLPGCLSGGCVGKSSPPTEEEIELLIQDLGSSKDPVRYEAREQLIEAGNLTVEPLIKALEEYEEDDTELRFEVLYILSIIGDEQAVDPLIRIVTDKEENLEFRVQALQTLGMIAASTGSEKAMDTFASILGDEDEELYLKISALETLELMTGEGLDTVTTNPAIYERSVEILLQSLQSENETVSWTAAMHLGGGGEEAVEPLVQVLKNDEREDMRVEAAGSLGKIGGDRAFKALVTALETDESEFVRWSAAYSLGIIGDERAVEPLGEALKRDESIEVRKTTVEALANYGNYEAIDLLKETLENENENIEVRKAAVSALRRINSNFGEEKAIEVLRRNSDCENETLRLMIADILYEVETGNIPEPIEEIEEIEEPLEESSEPTEVEENAGTVELKEENS